MTGHGSVESPDYNLKPHEAPDTCTSGPCSARLANCATAMGLGGLYIGIAKAGFNYEFGADPQAGYKSGTAQLSKNFTLISRSVATFAAAGVIFSAVDCFSESIRDKKDPLNAAYGAATAGAVLALKAKRFDACFVAALLSGTSMYVIGLNGPYWAPNWENEDRRRTTLKMKRDWAV
jgi:hypothetical protein